VTLGKPSLRLAGPLAQRDIVHQNPSVNVYMNNYSPMIITNNEYISFHNLFCGMSGYIGQIKMGKMNEEKSEITQKMFRFSKNEKMVKLLHDNRTPKTYVILCI